MEKDLINAYNKKKKILKKELIDLDYNNTSDFLNNKEFICFDKINVDHSLKEKELQNYNLLDGYVSYLYQYYLYLTSKENYIKENNLPQNITEKELEEDFIKRYKSIKEKFDNILSSEPTKRDINIYNLLHSSLRNNLLNTLTLIKKIFYDKNNITRKINYEFTNICGFKNLNKEDHTYSISELERIKLELENNLSFFKQTKNIFENYSPTSYINMQKDPNLTIVDKVFIGTHSYSIIGNAEFSRIKRWTDYNYELHKKLKIKAIFSKKSKKQLYDLTCAFKNISRVLFNILEEYITSVYKTLLLKINPNINKKIDILYLNNNYESIMRDIQNFITNIEKDIKQIDNELLESNEKMYQSKKIINNLILTLKEKYHISFEELEEIINYDLIENYRKVHLSILAKELDRMVSDEIIRTYGKLGDEIVYRTY